MTAQHTKSVKNKKKNIKTSNYVAHLNACPSFLNTRYLVTMHLHTSPAILPYTSAVTFLSLHLMHTHVNSGHMNIIVFLSSPHCLAIPPLHMQFPLLEILPAFSIWLPPDHFLDLSCTIRSSQICSLTRLNSIAINYLILTCPFWFSTHISTYLVAIGFVILRKAKDALFVICECPSLETISVIGCN